MHFFRNFFIGAVLLLLVLLCLPWLIPTSSYVPKLEAIAESQLNQKVKINSMRLALLPSPRLHIKGLLIGDSLLNAQVLTVVPDVFSLFGQDKVISAIQVDSLGVKSDALVMLSHLAKAKDSGVEPSHVVVNLVEISEFEYVTPKLKLPKFNILLALSNNKPIKANIKSLDGLLSLVLEPSSSSSENEAYTVNADARDWVMPMAYPFKLDTMHMQAVLRGKELQINHLEAKAYQGAINASAVLNFAKDFELKGQLRVQGLNLAPALNVVTANNKLSGQLMLNGPFKAKAESLELLLDKLSANFKFEVKNGVIKGVDLLKIASLLLTKSNSDGNTQFDSFMGKLIVIGKQYQLSHLVISSGLIKATGNIKVNKNSTIEGLVKVEVKNSATLVAVPLEVSGTLSDPSVLPTKAAMAGAVVGTAILGPGVGTSVGIKVGEKLESIKKGLFGGK